VSRGRSVDHQCRGEEEHGANLRDHGQFDRSAKARLAFRPEQGTTSLSLHLYADASGEEPTVLEYRDIAVHELDPANLSVAPDSDTRTYRLALPGESCMVVRPEFCSLRISQDVRSYVMANEAAPAVPRDITTSA
jgi:hypothetical protein